MLYQVLAAQTQAWREAGYPCEDYPVVGEILDWQTDPETGGLRFLRAPQLRALEVYWYRRALKGTPHVFDLYCELYPRLQTIASLPRLAIFSDEAHHLYGQSLDTGLKRVRQTVDYLAENTQVICVVNTTGTPYYKRQPLKDVVIRYGLREGITDGYLKEVAGNIRAYDFEGSVEQYVAHVIRDFFETCGNVRLPNGAPARLAMYFPQTDDLVQLRPVIDQALVEVGQSPALCLVNTSDDTLTKPADVDAFNRLNDPEAPHRVMLLVNKGTEGWNCPSLFACALVRKLTRSNNFVLQAASRCLRQVPGNTHRARVYLSQDNFSILDRQLQETYGETIADLNREITETRRARIVLRKLDIPPLVVTQILRTVRPKDGQRKPLALQRPTGKNEEELRRRDYDLTIRQATQQVLQQIGETVVIETVPEAVDAYSAAVDLAAQYRLDFWEVYGQLRGLYDSEEIPLFHLRDLCRQIEEQTCNSTFAP